MPKDAHPDDLTAEESTGLLNAIDELGSHRPRSDDDDDADDVDDEEEDGADEGADDDDPGGEDDDADDGADDEDPGEDEDDEDEDEDDDDEDDEGADADASASVASGDDAAEPITRADGATWNGVAKRWQKEGAFVEGGPPEIPAAKDKAGAAGATTADTGWAPLAITVDREAVPIPEAQISRANGHVIIGIPEAKFVDFQRRLGRGVAAERNWRQLNDGIRQLDEEKKALAERPPVRTDSEVEADFLLELLKPQLSQMFDETELENITLKIKQAQIDEKAKLTTWEASRVTARETEQAERVAEVNELADMVAGIISEDNGTLRPEFAHLDDEAQAELMRTVVRYSKALVAKQGDKYVRQHELAQTVVAQFAATKKGAAAPAPKPDSTPAKPGTTEKGKDKGTGDRAEKFNKGVDKAARASSTNLKERRRAADSRPPTRGTTGGKRKKKDGRTREMREEDRFRKLTRSYTGSASLDLGD